MYDLIANSLATYRKTPQLIVAPVQAICDSNDMVHQQVNMTIHNLLGNPAFKSPTVGDTPLSWVDSKDDFLPELIDDVLEPDKCRLLSQKLESCLKEAKDKQLQCAEVLIPSNLIFRIVRDILLMSEKEPCGIRGCAVYVNLEEKHLCRRIGKVKCDPDTVATFEVVLTLKQDCSSWLSLRHLIPARLLKSIGRNSPLVLSENYMLNKKKLYRSSSLHC
ncbi:DNA damage-inducible transcript 4-like protein [Limulus polyphemus]|uniref:DNA damage-inducible transcript 4-like protein n=1 Tax=Limulus polyphemus TaxID=6850 RepID=A0ABM1B9P8_LIMPO|nr:DNA damage-inducible transcript 4-like protein [Limulus polyphemus]